VGVFYISKINNGGLIATLGHYQQYRNIIQVNYKHQNVKITLKY